MADVWEQLLNLLQQGEQVALATVVSALGPTPRGPGTRMVIRRDGQHAGTVGGGCGEAEVIRAGLTTLDTRKPRFVRADLTEEVTEEASAACGGTMGFLVVPWGADLLPVVKVVAGALASRQPVLLLTELGPDRPPITPAASAASTPGAISAASTSAVGGGMVARRLRQKDTAGREQAAGAEVIPEGFAWAGLEEATARALDAAVTARLRSASAGGTAMRLPTQMQVTVGGETHRLLVEELQPPPVLLICGGGHIAVPLSQLGEMLGFSVTVIDDRPSFAHPARFPAAERILCAPFEQALADFPVDGNTYAVVVTRGHRHDLECVRRLLGKGAAYLGMIGSRRRVAGVMELLRQEGFPPETLEELHSPVGLDIGAETPAEIAVSIAAEIIKVRHGGSGQSLTLAHKGGRKG